MTSLLTYEKTLFKEIKPAIFRNISLLQRFISLKSIFPFMIKYFASQYVDISLVLEIKLSWKAKPFQSLLAFKDYYDILLYSFYILYFFNHTLSFFEFNFIFYKASRKRYKPLHARATRSMLL